jgi:hypothetical protein
MPITLLPLGSGGGSPSPGATTSSGEVMEWIEPDGTAHALNDAAAVHVLVGRSGLFMPPLAHVEDRVPLTPGSLLRAIDVQPRVVDLPLWIHGETPSALRQRVRDVLRWFDPLRGDGRLRVTAPDGEERELVCRYAGGLQLVEDAGSHRMTSQTLVLTLRAAEPYWRAVTAESAAFTIEGAVTFFPLFPLRLTASTVFGAGAIDNPGDVEAYPIWTLTGPGDTIVLRNLTTGEKIELATVLLPGDVIAIDTSPRVRTITLNGATNLWPDASYDSALWWLQPGENEVRIEMSNATTESALVVAYRPRFYGP